MKLGTGRQQPTERLLYSAEYAEVLADGDTLKQVAATLAPTGLLIENATVAGSQVRFWASGGTSGTSYVVTLTVETWGGRIFQDEVTIRVKEI